MHDTFSLMEKVSGRPEASQSASGVKLNFLPYNPRLSKKISSHFCLVVADTLQ